MSRTEQALRSFRETRSGLLAFDEQLVTVRQPAAAPSIVTSTELRRSFYESCIATPGLSTWIGGLSFFEETLHQRATSGSALVIEAQGRGMITGGRIDTGSVSFAGAMITDGIHEIASRHERFAKCGAHFAKWHIALRSDAQIDRYEEAFAEDCQRAGMFVSSAKANDLLPLLAVEVSSDSAPSRFSTSFNRFFRQLFSTLRRREPSPAPIAVLIRLDRAEDASGRARRIALLQAVQAELPPSIAILFLGLDHADQLCEAAKAFGDAGNLPWPVRFALGPDTQTRLLTCWQDGRPDQEIASDLLLEQARAISDMFMATSLAGA